MAGEEASVTPAASPGLVSDHEKKRKPEDLGTDAPEPLEGGDLDSKAADQETDDGCKNSDGSELKRPRIEDIEDNNGQLDGLASENGYQEKEKVDNLREDEEDKVNQQQVAVEIALNDGNGQNKTVEGPASAEVEQKASGDFVNEEPFIVNEKPKAGNEERGINLLAQEPSAEVAQEQDESTIDLGSGSEAQTTSRKVEVPNNKVGVLIGKAGETIRHLQYNSGAKIQIMRDADADPRAATRPVELIGTLESITKAEKLISDVIAEADAGGSPSLVARGFSTVQSVAGDQIEIKVPNEKVGLIIGKGGETIKNLQTSSGARIQLVPQHLRAGDQSKERIVRVTGDRKQIEIAREMIKEVMEQLPRPSPLSSGYSQQAFRPRGPVAPHWGNRGPPHYTGYEYQQRGQYPSQNQPHHHTSYGNYPPQQAPRSTFGPSWDQRPPSAMQSSPPQANYNYGQPNPFPQATGQSYGQGYNDVNYENQMTSQHPYPGHGVPQTGYPHSGGSHPGYGPQDQYARPYGMHPQVPGQNYGQPRPNQPELSYQPPVTSTQAYGSNIPPQQSYPYASSGQMQQTYPPYGSGPTPEGFHHAPPPTAPGPGYPQQGGQPVSGYGQARVQQPGVYSAGGPAGGYGSYPSQPGYTEQLTTNNSGYGYQDAAYGSSTASAAYAAPSTLQAGYVQPATSLPGYDQSNPQSGVYGTAPGAVAAAPAPTPAPAQAPAPAGYGKSLSPQPVYPQYDTSQIYGASR